MRASVLTDAAVAKLAGRFVWLDVDTERPRNAAFLEKFPVEVWPTFLVVDPATERPVLKWIGTATASDIARLLDDGARAVRGAGNGANAALARADAAAARGEVEAAERSYRESIALGGPSWRRRDRALLSLVLMLQAAGRFEACARAAGDEASGVPPGPALAGISSAGLGCALSAPEEARWRAGAIARLEPFAIEALGAPGVLADDRSGLYEGLVEARAAAGDARGARRVAGRWWAFLEREGRRARSAEARAALDSARVQAALALGDPARAVPALRRSERALPRDYNPPARLATLYREMGRYREALAASSRALALAYGPRKLRVLEQRSSIQEAAGDGDAARATIEEALAFARMLPPAQRPEGLVREMQAKVAGRE